MDIGHSWVDVELVGGNSLPAFHCRLSVKRGPAGDPENKQRKEPSVNLKLDFCFCTEWITYHRVYVLPT